VKKVVLVGSNQLTRHLIDWSQPADFWLFNEAASRDWVEHCDAVFQMHAPAIWRNPKNVNDPKHYEWLKQDHLFPVYMQEVYPDVPASAAYPLEEIAQSLLPNMRRKGGDVVKYFTSSPAYAIALAVYQGYDEIEIVGIEMASGTEYERQRDGVTFWLGVAAGRGITVILQDESLLMAGKLYGYTGEVVIQRQRFEIVYNGLLPKLEQAKAASFEAGARVKLLLEQLAAEKSQSRAQELYRKLAEAMNAKADIDYQYGIATGAATTNRRYMDECDALIQAAGGEKAAAVLEGAQ
jgi:hypothetical protein